MAIGGGLVANAKPREITISAVVTRADGRIENVGSVAYYHQNPLRRWVGNLCIWLKRKVWK